jgi:hypothetical protein
MSSLVIIDLLKTRLHSSTDHRLRTDRRFEQHRKNVMFGMLKRMVHGGVKRRSKLLKRRCDERPKWRIITLDPT